MTSALSTTSLPSLTHLPVVTNQPVGVVFVQDGKAHYRAVLPQSKAAAGNGRPAAAAKAISSAPVPATFFLILFFF